MQSAVRTHRERSIRISPFTQLLLLPHSLFPTVCFSGTERAPALAPHWLTEESPNWVWNSSSAASSCSSAQNSPCETLQSLTAPQALSLSPGFSAGFFFGSLPTVSVEKHITINQSHETECHKKIQSIFFSYTCYTLIYLHCKGDKVLCWFSCTIKIHFFQQACKWQKFAKTLSALTSYCFFVLSSASPKV